MSTRSLISDADASPEVLEIFNDIRKTRGSDFINNFWRALAHDPAQLKAIWGELKLIMGHNENSAIDPLTKEMIYIAVSMMHLKLKKLDSGRNISMAYAMVADKAGAAGVFKKQDIELGKPKKGEALIKHTAIGMNFIDIYQRSGLYPAPGGYPAILGCEGAGVVEAIGAGVSCTHRMIAADRLVKIPKGVSDETAAACMLKGLTAQYLIHDCYKPKKDDTVLVHAAAGGVGLIVGQWLKDKGIRKMTSLPKPCA